jgi:hypothetical protein
MARTGIRTFEDVLARCDEVGECNLWRLALSNAKSGQPVARINGEMTYIRAFVFALSGRKRIPGRELSPACGEKRCVTCIAQVTRSQIVAKSMSKRAQSPLGRIALREKARKVGIAKLSAEIAAEIRSSDEGSLVLSERYGVNISSINRVRALKTWAPIQNSIFNLGA